MTDSDERDRHANGATDGGAVLAPERTEPVPPEFEAGEADDVAPEAESRAPTWVERAGRRIVRRPVEWARRPWPTDRVVRVAVTAFTLILTTVIMMNVTHFNPLNAK